MDELLEEMKDLLRNFGSAVDSVMLVDGLGDVQLSHPDESLEIMGNVTASSIGDIENQIKKGLNQPCVVQEMEIVTQDKRILALKISEDSDYLLCIVCLKNTKRLGLIKNMFENTFKQKMIDIMKKVGMIKVR